MQYLLIPKLDTHWTGFQTNAAVSIPSVAHFQYPCIIHASPMASHTQRSGLSKRREKTKKTSTLPCRAHKPGVNKPRSAGWPTALTAQAPCQRRQAPGLGLSMATCQTRHSTVLVRVGHGMSNRLDM